MQRDNNNTGTWMERCEEIDFYFTFADIKMLKEGMFMRSTILEINGHQMSFQIFIDCGGLLSGTVKYHSPMYGNYGNIEVFLQHMGDKSTTYGKGHSNRPRLFEICDNIVKNTETFGRWEVGTSWGFRDNEIKNMYLRDWIGDSIVFHVHLTIWKPRNSRTVLQIQQSSRVCTEIANELFENKYGSETCDFKFVLDDNEENNFMVHKEILSRVSPVFKTMFNSQMSETITNEMTITDASIGTIRAFVSYLYDENGTAFLSHVPTNKGIQDLLSLAQKYEINALVSYCEQDLCHNINLFTAVDYLIFADFYELKQLKSRTIQFVHNNLSTFACMENVRFFVKVTDELLQDVVIGRFHH